MDLISTGPKALSAGNLYISNWGLGSGTNAVFFPCIHGVLSHTPQIALTGLYDPGYGVDYTDPVGR